MTVFLTLEEGLIFLIPVIILYLPLLVLPVGMPNLTVTDCAAITGNCVSTVCVDTACEVQENSCLTWCGGQFQYFPSSQESCENEYFCNSNSTLCEGFSNKEGCLKGVRFECTRV